jgi:AhpD family alkylhydroperoxidase
MSKRINMHEIEPETYKIIAGFNKYLDTTLLEVGHKDLIKIRASQLNGCAYCVDLHTKDARKNGESERRLYNLTSWAETPLFDEKERAILKLTEEMTFIHQRVADTTYQTAVDLLGEKYVAQVMAAIVAINAWNRIGVATNMAPAL